MNRSDVMLHNEYNDVIFRMNTTEKILHNKYN